MILSPEVESELARLGARVERLGTSVQGAERLPPEIEALLFGIRWPNGAEYTTHSNAPRTLRLIRFNIVHWLTPDDVSIADQYERRIVGFAHADGGNMIVAVDVDDSEASNPVVYILDHDDPEQQLSSLYHLSDFLSWLERS
ncbi:MAG: hypothetical protein GYB68_14485 [Chloroflexi bacterium]|nr:hypothetical protein [Chloroflexota bacterium]